MEFKEDIPPKSEKYMKTVVAFANAIYDSCKPKTSPNVYIQEIEGKSVIVVEILPGMQKTYCIKSFGMLEGVFIRVSGTTRKAMQYQIQELILDGTNRTFDRLPSLKEVTKSDIEDFCEGMYEYTVSHYTTENERKSIKKVTKNQLFSWGVLTENNGKLIPSNGYLLLSGDNDTFPEAVIQCAVFKGTVRGKFISKKEFSGPLYQQVDDAYEFVLQHIDLNTQIIGMVRHDTYELPVDTIREIIANAVCHRSYLMPGKIQVALYDDRLEVTSPGMLDKDLTIEKMKTGLSKIRNKGIARAFSYMNIVETWGSGIPKMYQEAKEYGLPEPELNDLGSDFRVNLYKKIAKKQLNDNLRICHRYNLQGEAKMGIE